MARIDPRLLKRLQTRLGLSRSRVYALIEQKVRDSHLPRPLAAIALASEWRINISRFASADDLATIRQGARPAVVSPVTVSPTVTAARPRATPAPRHRRQGPTRRENSVFVVHGRNEEARAELFTFLRALGVHPIEWGEAISRTGEGTPYVGAILETALRDAAAVVVLLTPDDEARVIERFLRPDDPDHESRLEGQPRANVLFEAGMAFGGKQQNTVLVQMGHIRPFSDIAGRHVVRLNNTVARRQELATKLRAAGCTVNTDGTDWHTAGNLDEV